MTKKDNKRKIIVIILILAMLGIMMYVFTVVPRESLSLNWGQNPPVNNTGGPPGTWCTDHDGGKTYTVTSYCDDNDQRYLQDYCSGSTLMEAYCDANNDCQYSVYSCLGCVDGKCPPTDEEEEEPPGTKWLCCIPSGAVYDTGCYLNECPPNWSKLGEYSSQTECAIGCYDTICNNWCQDEGYGPEGVFTGGRASPPTVGCYEDEEFGLMNLNAACCCRWGDVPIVEPFCYDSDADREENGLDPSNNAGYCQDATGLYYDECLEDGSLSEMHCVGNKCYWAKIWCSNYGGTCDTNRCVLPYDGSCIFSCTNAGYESGFDHTYCLFNSVETCESCANSMCGYGVGPYGKFGNCCCYSCD